MSQPPALPVAAGAPVTIAGGGIAGIAAALTLAERGCTVTLFEAGERLGGCLSAQPQQYPGDTPVAVNYEVSPHMFGEWYDNFFDLVGKAGLERGTHFDSCPKVAFLHPGRPTDYSFLNNNGALDTDLMNIFSGVANPTDMFLYYYTLLGILTQDFSFGPDHHLRNVQTLNGFIVTRPYITERVAAFFEEALVNIWAVDSFRTSSRRSNAPSNTRAGAPPQQVGLSLTATPSTASSSPYRICSKQAVSPSTSIRRSSASPSRARRRAASAFRQSRARSPSCPSKTSSSPYGNTRPARSS